MCECLSIRIKAVDVSAHEIISFEFSKIFHFKINSLSIIIIKKEKHVQEERKIEKEDIGDIVKKEINHEEVLCDVIATFKQFVRVKTVIIDTKIRSVIQKLQVQSRKIACSFIVI